MSSHGIQLGAGGAVVAASAADGVPAANVVLRADLNAERLGVRCPIRWGEKKTKSIPGGPAEAAAGEEPLRHAVAADSFVAGRVRSALIAAEMLEAGRVLTVRDGRNALRDNCDRVN